MQKCPHFHVKYSSMNHYLVKTFTKKLENLSISDYYGLNSPGLTCYLNSVLQVLFMTENFREAVKSEHSTLLDQRLGELFCILEGNMAKTHTITKQLEITDVYEQRDAAEYFEKILCQTSQKASKVFKGELNHKTRCHICHTTTDSRNFFWVLPLSMDVSTFNLHQGLEDFFKEQKVSEENQMFCNICNEKQDADIKYEMTLCPDVLTLLLKRFTFDYRLNCYIKLHSRADVVQTLNIENCRYDLYAVVNHCGTLTGGHYTADIKSFETGQWYHFDDNIVKTVKDHIELGKNSLRWKTAYLLMYRKVGGQTMHSNGSDLEAQGGRSDVETEDSWDETETGNTLASDHLRTDGCRGGDYKYQNGDTFTDDALKRKQVNSQEKLNKGANQRAGLVRQQEDTSHQGHAEAARQPQDDMLEKTLGPHLGTMSSHWTPNMRNNFSVKGQKVNKISNKQDTTKKSGTETYVSDRSSSSNRIERAQTKAVRHPREAAAAAGIQEQNMNLSKDTCVGDVGQSNVKICNDTPLVQSSLRHSSSPSRDDKRSECNGSPCGCRKSNSFKNNKEKIKAVVASDCRHEASKPVTRRDKTVSPHDAKMFKSLTPRRQKKPWT